MPPPCFSSRQDVPKALNCEQVRHGGGGGDGGMRYWGSYQLPRKIMGLLEPVWEARLRSSPIQKQKGNPPDGTGCERRQGRLGIPLAGRVPGAKIGGLGKRAAETSSNPAPSPWQTLAWPQDRKTQGRFWNWEAARCPTGKRHPLSLALFPPSEFCADPEPFSCFASHSGPSIIIAIKFVCCPSC